MYKVRFHLARGKHYQHWQVKDRCGDVEYYNPEEVTLIMKECKLHNQPNATKKILLGENKRPCAWVICKEVEVVSKQTRPFSTYVLAFNPRMSWSWKAINEGYMEPLVLNYNMDFKEFSFLATHSRQIYCFRDEFIKQVQKL